jgi:hypothetical protein
MVGRHGAIDTETGAGGRLERPAGGVNVKAIDDCGDEADEVLGGGEVEEGVPSPTRCSGGGSFVVCHEFFVIVVERKNGGRGGKE